MGAAMTAHRYRQHAPELGVLRAKGCWSVWRQPRHDPASGNTAPSYLRRGTLGRLLRLAAPAGPPRVIEHGLRAPDLVKQVLPVLTASR